MPYSALHARADLDSIVRGVPFLEDRPYMSVAAFRTVGLVGDAVDLALRARRL